MGVGNKRTLTKTRRKLRGVSDNLDRDVDQIKADMLSPRHLRQWKDTKAPEDLPGLGQHYCVECAKWFETEISLVGHQKGKPHKRRVKQLKEEPYTQKEAEAVVGLRTDNKGPSKGGPERAVDQEVEMET
ncbi:Zinc finger protein bud20 [Colletotrichum gloeosporioides]|uniref:Zinc finger protein bud20 n=1 Tax=Colletotrichum gloeosporioides TaxID=474922 RepID=A0A8H4FG67_COLGL|nr:Zinc finger protein bud20 [Colletotrichum gloeosporioides]KAF3801077.1 Zinc finger protein bud20 [Colletotrichum gloeosporioides]